MVNKFPAKWQSAHVSILQKKKVTYVPFFCSFEGGDFSGYSSVGGGGGGFLWGQFRLLLPRAFSRTRGYTISMLVYVCTRLCRIDRRMPVRRWYIPRVCICVCVAAFVTPLLEKVFVQKEDALKYSPETRPPRARGTHKGRNKYCALILCVMIWRETWVCVCVQENLLLMRMEGTKGKQQLKWRDALFFFCNDVSYIWRSVNFF